MLGRAVLSRFHALDVATVQQLADYFEWQVQIGRGKCAVELNPHSIPCGWTCQLASIKPPSPDREYDAQRKIVFIDAVLED